MSLGWAGLRDQAPELAGRAQEVLEDAGFVMLGTIRRDGSPRISPVEIQLVEGELMMVMIPHTHKAADILREPRVVLQSPVGDAADPGLEVKLSGRVSVRTEESLKEALADRIEEVSGWRPERDWLFLSVAIGAVSLIEWQRGEMIMTRWDPELGVRGPERRRLDMAAGRYREITAP